MFGCLVNDELIVDFTKKRLIRIQTNKSEKSFLIGAVTVSDSVINLLRFILIDIEDDVVVSKERILNNLWDNEFNSSSTQKLWMVMKELKRKLSSIGINNDLVVKVSNSQYKKADVSIRGLFFNDTRERILGSNRT